MFKNIKNIVFHILVLALSASIALSLPYTGKLIADNYLTYWSLIESEKIFLIGVEIGFAVLLILFFNYLVKSWRDRKLSKLATNDMGLVSAIQPRSIRSKKRAKKFKEQHGLAKDIALLGSTGFSTFVDPDGDLHGIMQDCREARVMLMNPFSPSVCMRANSIPDSEITPERFKEQIMKSIGFLKDLKTLQKNIRLKLYEDPPLLKLTILGDYVFLKYFHTGLNVKDIPEYIFQHSSHRGSLFHPLYDLFLAKWRDPDTPEYDFESDELIYRDRSGNEVRREKFNELPFAAS